MLNDDTLDPNWKLLFLLVINVTQFAANWMIFLIIDEVRDSINSYGLSQLI